MWKRSATKNRLLKIKIKFEYVLSRTNQNSSLIYLKLSVLDIVRSELEIVWLLLFFLLYRPPGVIGTGWYKI